MSEEKRPVLSLKRKPAENSTAPAEATPAPGVVRRKKVVVVSSPPAWKAKKEKLEKVKQAAEAAARTGALSSPAAAGTGHYDAEGILATAVRRKLTPSAGNGHARTAVCRHCEP